MGLFCNVSPNETAIFVCAVGIEVERQVSWCWWHDVDEIYPPSVWGAGVVSLGHRPCVEEGSVVVFWRRCSVPAVLPAGMGSGFDDPKPLL